MTEAVKYNLAEDYYTSIVVSIRAMRAEKHWKENFRMPKREELRKLFEISEEGAKESRLAYHKTKEKALLDKEARWNRLLEDANPAESALIYGYLNKIKNEIIKIRYSIKMLRKTGGFDTVDLAELKKHVPLDRILQTNWINESGNRAKTSCPLHNEKSASFTWYKETNSFYCFGCKQGGSVIDFVMKLEGYDIYRAIKYLQPFL